jgi:4-amino-4-deoxy-L-arabinose transferase-like glycosyltransferase
MDPRCPESCATMHTPPPQDGGTRLPGWFESEALWLLVLVTAVYACRAGDLPFRGEEPTRAQIAREMVLTGDAVVPREQGEPFLSRPPLQNWLIALSCQALGRWDAAAARLPSVLATILATLLIYRYSRTFLSPTGSFAAGVSFATMGEMFQTGRLAETEAVFILLVGASLLVWHGGMLRGWPETRTWCAGYGLMVLAALTKGPQAPTYFVAAVTVYLVLTGQWRKLLSRAHFTGAAFGLLIALAWMVPFYRQLGWKGVHDVWLGDSAIRFHDWKFSEVATHLVVFPLEILGCTLPWSLLLLLYLSPKVRGSLRQARPQILFVSICLIVSFPSCWLPPGGVSRYFSPLYPCLAVLIGATVEHCTRPDASRVVTRAWRAFATVTALVMVVAAGTVLTATALKDRLPIGRLAEPPGIAVFYAAASLGLAAVALRSRNAGDPLRVQVGVVAVSGFMAITFVGVLTDLRIRRGEDTAGAVVRLKEQLPPGQRLVSFGHVDSLFAYYYGRPIVPLTWEAARANDVAGVEYFCFYNAGTGRPALPFDWEEVAAVSVDRNHQEPPDTVVVVGRMRPAAGTRAAGDTRTDTSLAGR